MKLIDLTGQKFGYLTVLYRGENKGSQPVWHCKCDCGKECDILGRYLRSGHTKSCGHIKAIAAKQVGKANALNLTDQKFDYLTVLEPTSRRGGSEIIWKCKCICGNITYVRTHDLTGRRIHSCGCMRKQSLGEQIIKEILTINNIDFKQEYSPTDLFSSNGGLMRFDFALLKDKKPYRIIEYDGEQHFFESDASHFFSSLEEIQERDKIKNKWCKDNNIPLIRIPYTERDNITLEMLLGDKFLIG